MTGTIFTEQLKRIWRHILYWGLGMGFFTWLIMLVIPDSEVLNEYASLLEAMPPFLMQAFGASDMEALATAEGFIGLEIFSFVILLLAAYAISSGMNIVSNDEDSGSLDVLLALPVPRWRIIVEKFAAYALVIVTIAISTYAGLYLGNSMTELDVNMQVMAAASFNLIPATLAIMAFTVFVAGFTARRGIVLAASSAFVVISYFVYTIGNAVNTAAANLANSFSVFSYYDHEGIIISGSVQWTNVVVLLVLATVLIATSLMTFERRDVGV